MASKLRPEGSSDVRLAQVTLWSGGGVKSNAYFFCSELVLNIVECRLQWHNESVTKDTGCYHVPIDCELFLINDP